MSILIHIDESRANLLDEIISVCVNERESTTFVKSSKKLSLLIKSNIFESSII